MIDKYPPAELTLEKRWLTENLYESAEASALQLLKS
jgi:hypothetical protein